MYEKMRGIVLHVLKYSDKNSIAHIFTDERGRMSFLVQQGATRAARMRNAMFMPLSIIEFEARITAGREIASLKDVRCVYPLTEIYADPVKSAIAMFMSELLTRAIQESEQNTQLWQYLLNSVRLLNSIQNGTANFHICFLYNLGAFLGIQPDTGTYHTGYWFDMENGIFTEQHPPHHHVLNPQEANALVTISRMSFSNLHLFKLTHTQRNDILATALRYFQLHNSTVGSLKSPEVLRQLFSQD